MTYGNIMAVMRQCEKS